jgi:hypothetical protein
MQRKIISVKLGVAQSMCNTLQIIVLSILLLFMASDYTFGIFKHFFISVKQTYIPFPSGDALCKCFFVFVDLSDDEKFLPKIRNGV